MRPGNAGQEGSNEVMSSRNLVSRPAGAKPAWPGVSPPEPVVSLATGAVTRPAKRRHTSAWAVGNAATKSMTYRVPRVLNCSKATTSRPKWARAAWNPAGWEATARATWGRPRNLGGPRFSSEQSGGTGDPVITLRRSVPPRDAGTSGKEQAPAPR